MGTKNDRLRPCDRVRFVGDGTRWTVRAETSDGRYSVCTGEYRGDVCYTILDFQDQIRGPLNVIGQGMGITTLEGPDSAIDEVIERLESHDSWEVSHRNRVALDIRHVVKAVKG